MPAGKKVNPLFVNTGGSEEQLKGAASPTASRAGSQLNDEKRVEKKPASAMVRHREVREDDVSFEDAYKRETIYLDRALKPKLDRLIKKQRRSKTALLNEAIEDLLQKYNAT